MSKLLSTRASLAFCIEIPVKAVRFLVHRSEKWLEWVEVDAVTWRRWSTQTCVSEKLKEMSRSNGWSASTSSKLHYIKLFIIFRTHDENLQLILIKRDLRGSVHGQGLEGRVFCPPRARHSIPISCHCNFYFCMIKMLNKFSLIVMF